jgi:hypothetical protein
VIVGLLVASHTVPLSVSVIFGQRVSQTVSGSASGSISVIVSQRHSQSAISEHDAQ